MSSTSTAVPASPSTNQSEQPGKTAKTLTLPFILLIIITLFNGLYQRGLDSGIPLYYTDFAKAPATLGGTLVAIFTISCMIMRLIGGRITDTTDHIKALYAGMLCLLVGAVIPAIFPNLPVVICARVIQGCGFALSSNVISTLILETGSKKKLGKRISYKGIGTSLATMFGAALATWMLYSFNYRVFYVLYGVLSLAGIVMVYVVSRDGKIQQVRQDDAAMRAQERQEKATEKRGFRATLADYKQPQAIPFMIIQFLRRLPKGVCLAFMLVYAKQVGLGTGALFFVITGIVTLLCRVCFADLFDHASPWILLPLMLLDVAGFGLLTMFSTWPIFIFAAICYGASIGCMSPLLKTFTAQSVSKEHWGIANGELQFMGDLGRAVSAFLGGIFIDMTDTSTIPAIICLFAAFASVCTAVTLLFVKRDNLED